MSTRRSASTSSASRAGASTAAPRSPGRRASPTTCRCRACCTASCCARRIRTRSIGRSTSSRAAAHPGVHLVLTGKDFPVPFGILPVSQDEYALAPDRVRYVGDPVAAVIAADEQTAVEALDLIDVKYKPLRTIATPEEAPAEPRAAHPRLRRAGQHPPQPVLEFGDVDEALATSDHVFEDMFFYEGNTHLPIEQHAAVAAVDGDGKLLLSSSTQTPHYVHRALARVLQMPAAHIRVIATPNGGGFGGKSDPFNHEIVVAKAALMLGRPVKICLTREEVFYCTAAAIRC